MARKLLYVEWLDHTSQSSDGRWVSKEQLDKSAPEACGTIGWLYKEDDLSLTLISTVGIGKDSDDDFGGDMTILQSCITKRKLIKF